MIRISIPWVVDVVSGLDDLDSVKAGVTRSAVWGQAYNAQSKLDALVSQSLYRDSLVTCRVAGERLRNEIASIISPSPDELISHFQEWSLGEAKKEFKTIFLAELATLPAFFVTPKKPYHLPTLLEEGETLMPADLAVKVPEAVFDVREAAICVAFERGTAAAFHLFRALESVVRAYYKTVSQGLAPPKQRNLGVYIKALIKCNASGKVIAALTQLKDLHRNPIAHPEVAILPDEAVNISGMVRSAIAAMLTELPVLAPTTTLGIPS
jgi:hypothetical protein